MKRNQLLKQLTAFLLVCGLLLPAAPARVKARMAAAAAPDYKTTFNVRPLNVVNGAAGTIVETGNWPLHRYGGVSFARPFRVGNNNFIFFMWRNSGDAIIQQFGQQFGADGQIGAATDARNLEMGWTAVDFIYGANTYLVLYNAFTGQVRTHQVLANGKFAAGQNSELTSPKLQDTDLFSPFQHNGQWRLFALDPWTGDAVTSTGDWTNMTESQWTRGWTSLDHLTHLGTAYRLAYKAVGDPQAGQSSETGRLVIQRLNNEGTAAQVLYDDNAGANWSSVSFVPSAGSLLSPHKILFYRNDTGAYEVRIFDLAAGLGPVSASGNLGIGYTDLKAVSMDGKTWLTALNEENAEPFGAANARTMGLTIHNELKNKAVGYQFLLMQSGKVIYSRAHGMTRLDVQTPLTTRTRLDLGSVGKMITTMTTLKLAEQGKVHLNQPIADQVDQDKYQGVTFNPWVGQRKVLDLMKQTTGMVEVSSAGCNGNQSTYQVTCQPFFTAAPTLTCEGGLCPRSYNNANFGALRQVIENVSGTQTTAELVQYTHNLWAKQIDLGGSSGIACTSPSNTYSFQRCAGGDDCVNYNGVWWRQEAVDKPYSTSCGAGGWHASARQMGEFMAAARYSKVLSNTLNDLFMSTEHTALKDGEPAAGATALGWEPAWQAETGGEKLLHKNGARIGVAYVTQLPNRMDAVLIVNTALENHPQGLLRDAYKYSAGLTSKPPIYVEVVAEGTATSGPVGEVAINTISNAGNGQHATAIRDSDGLLHVTGWNVMAGGAIQKEKSILAGEASEIAITDGEGFVTAMRNGSGNLQVTAWSTVLAVASSIKREGSAIIGAVSKVAATKLAGYGALDGRVATAVRNGEGNLQIDVWDFHNASNQVTRRDTIVGGPISEVAVKTLHSSTSLAQSTRMVTAVRNGEGKLQIDIWDINSAGQLTRKGKAIAGAVSAAAANNKIAIGRFDDDDLFTASINGDGKLELIQWTVSESGLLTKGAEGVVDSEITEIAVAAGTTVMRLKDDGKSKLINWRVVNGQFLRYGQADSNKVTQVAATGNVMTAARLDNGTLKLVKWEIVD